MGILQNLKRKKTRADPVESVIYYTLQDLAFMPGFTTLSECPEIKAGVDKIADLVSSMTIHLMKNTDKGDIRIKNHLSEVVDIQPYKYMTRKTWVHNIVNTMFLSGKGNAFVFPEVENGQIKGLKPLPPSKVSIHEGGDQDYFIKYGSTALYPDEFLHFVMNPDPEKPYQGTGVKVVLTDVIDNLRKATATKKEFLSGKYNPALIVKVDAGAANMDDEEAREKVYNNYVKSSKIGQPWVVSSEMIDVVPVKPLTLEDLAINETIKIDKKTVASILGVPPFILGVGDYNKDEYNNFINSKILPIAKIIEQELTRQLTEANTYFRCNPKSLYAYDIGELSKVGKDMFVCGIMTGNEVRDSLGLTPMDGLDQLILLENYIKLDDISKQNKLGGGDKDDEK